MNERKTSVAKDVASGLVFGRRAMGRSLLGRAAGAVVASATLIGFMAGTAVPADQAQAQMGMRMGGGMGMGTGAVSRRSLETYSRLLKLDESQKEAAGLLAEGYRGTLKELEKDMEGRMRKLQDEAQDVGFEVFRTEMPKIVREFGDRQQAAEKQFIEDVKSLLTPEQADLFPKVERHRRRETFLRMGMVSGAGVDVWSIQDRLLQQEGMVADESAGEVAEVMDRYDTDMDRLLQEMERMYKADMEKYAAGTEDMFDMGKIQDRLKPYNEMGVRIRDLNRDSTRKLEALLTEKGQKALREEFNKRAYPRVYRKGVAGKLFDAANKLPDLTAEQKEQLSQSKAQYERDVEPLNEAWAKAIDAAEAEGGGTMGVMMSQFGGGASNTALGDARKARREADKAAQERLMGLLTEDQKAQLPSEDSLREDPWQAMVGGGEEEEE